MQKAFLLMTVLESRGKHDYTCGGCLSHTTISDTTNEPVMDSAHKSTCGQKCNYVQKKSVVIKILNNGLQMILPQPTAQASSYTTLLF